MPTLLGLSLILLGLISGVYLVLKEQIFFSQAAPNLAPQNITFANIAEDSIAISWQTSSNSTSFITFGQNNPSEQTVLDDRDNDSSGKIGPKSRSNHYVTLKNLLPKTTYQFKIISGKLASDIKKFQTAAPITNKITFTPTIGSVIDGDTPLNDGIVYLSIGEATAQSSLIKQGGNFLIPLSYIRKADLSDVYPLTEGENAKLTIHSDKGDATMLFKLKSDSQPLPPIKLGQNIDLTSKEETPSPTSLPNTLSKYDLNSDGVINSTDYAILSSCIGKKPNAVLPGNISCAKADLNGDGVIDKKDQDLMSRRPKE